MLAVKLHKRKKTWLGKGSHLVPILEWKRAKIHIANWIKLLNRENTTRPNNCIRYITLVKIPDHHPVFLAVDWVVKLSGVIFKPLSYFSEAKEIIMEEVDLLPEIILGKPLPLSYIKWTKNIQLLYGSNKKSRL